MQNIPVSNDPDGVVRAEASRRAFAVKGDNYTVLESEQNKIFIASDTGDSVVFTLPAAKKGLRFTFMKGTADTDIWLTATGGAKINFGTANKSYKNVTDGNGVPCVVDIISNGTDWFVADQIGANWANDNA